MSSGFSVIRKQDVVYKHKEVAIELGHIVNGQRIKFYDDTMPGEPSVGKHYHATYSYEVGGKGYQYRYFGTKFPPEQLEMYYINNPRKIFSDLDTKREPFALVFFFFADYSEGNCDKFGEFDFIVINRAFGEYRNILRTLFYYGLIFRKLKV